MSAGNYAARRLHRPRRGDDEERGDGSAVRQRIKRQRNPTMSISSISTSASALARPDPAEFAQKMFARLDGDSDGKVTQDEFTSAMEKRFGKTDDASATGRPDAATIFQKTDGDGDGAITLEEFTTAFKAMRSSGGGQAGGGPQGAGGPPPGPPSGPPPSGASAAEEAEQVFDEMDTDKDGKVSAEELLAALKKKAEENGQSTDATNTSGASSASPDFEKLFAAIDTDGDGSVTQAELTSLFEALRPPREPHNGYAADGSPSDEAAIGSNKIGRAHV
jgi:Ca2+-binding EF-hand superfamily protein